MNPMRRIVIAFSGLLLAGILLLTSYQAQRRMNEIRVRERLVDTEIIENAPPLVVFTTVALGSFRGLIANFLWLRTHRMQDEGRYFEMVQLASWITMLQPRFTGATAYLAWNMAYNVSVTFSRPEDRWRWVRRGIELIRDEALVYNPGDPELYRELGWIYQHKLGQEMDDANIYYKTQLAEEMMSVLGGWPVDWQRWAEAPNDEPELRSRLGEEHPLWGWLQDRGIRLSEFERDFREGNGFAEETVEDLRSLAIRDTLEVYFRGRWLRQRLKMEPHRIARLNREYGELDWRLPEAHAIYWASRGLEVAEGGVDLACERMIFQSLNNAFAGGRLLYFRGRDEALQRPVVQFIPNVDIVDAVDRAYLDSIEQHPDNRSVVSARRNFLERAVTTLYMFGREEQAREYLRTLRRDFPQPEYRRPLEDFALQRLAGDVADANFNQAQGLVQGYLWQMCNDLSLGEFERAAAMERIAAAIWQRYMARIGERTHERRGLPPYPEMRQNAIRQALEVFHPELAARLRAALRQMGFPVDPQNS